MKNSTEKNFIRQFYHKNTFVYILAALAALLTGSLNLFISWVMQQMIDTISGVDGAKELNFLTACTLLIVLLIILFKTVSYHSLPRFLSRAMEQYKNFAFRKLTEKSFSSFTKENTALYLSALSNDANSVETGYLEKQFSLLTSGVMFIGAILMMLFYSPLMTLVAAAFSILPILAALFAGNKAAAAERKVSDCNQSFLASLKDSLNGFSVIKSFRAEDAVSGLMEKQNHLVARSKCEKRRISIVIGAISGVAGVTAQLGTFLAGAYLTEAGLPITPGILIIFVDLMAYVIQPIREMPELLAERKAALALIRKLSAALESHGEDHGTELSGRLTSGISLQDLTFSYDGNRKILNDLSFHFEPGKSYAVVGASGSGKSTLLNLLMGAHVSGSESADDGYNGQIFYDDTELRRISSRSLYEHVSLIQQNVFVFNASIRENITMFQDFPKDAVDRAIRLAGLAPVIAAKGENYLCGENGNGLSGGEKQRISIARSLLRNASVLLADEATASLDARTAWQVSDSILNLSGLTRIVVTHSLDARLLSRYDSILTLKGGRIAESGSFAELMEKKGYFYSLYTVAQE